MAPSRGLAVVALLVCAAPHPAGAEGLYLHVVPTSGRVARPAAGEPLRMDVWVARPEKLAAALPASVRSVKGERVRLELHEYPQLEPRAPDGFLAPSFVVDFDEPAVARLSEALRARSGGAPSLADLRRAADEAIPRKTLERGFDLASRVAGSGTGDCTEHAVLLAALARAAGRPARVAVGFVILALDGEPGTYGHAWAEIHDGARWLPVDATPLGQGADGARVLGYLPTLVLVDEGPGYAMAVAAAMQRTWVRRLELR